MIIDYRESVVPADIEADLCIVGSGAAGIALARAFLGSQIRVCLLESGGFETDSRIQSLYEGEDVGYQHDLSSNLDGCRDRFFGGTTNSWGGVCAPLSAIDFERRTWVPHSGWPFTREELESYFEAAHVVCEAGPYRYDPETLTDGTRKFPDFSDQKLRTAFWRFSPPTRFGHAYRRELENSQNVQTFLYANVLKLEVNADASSVREALIGTLDGKRGAARAKMFVLACGGIENARLLLLSNRVQKQGLGNQHDLVGRFFMAHLHPFAAIVTTPETVGIKYLFDRHPYDGTDVRATIEATEPAQRREKILNCSADIYSFDPDDSTGYGALREIVGEIKRGEWQDDLDDDLWTVIKDIDSTISGLYHWFRDDPVKWAWLNTVSEQAPNPTSRVALSEEKDDLELNRVHLDWRLTELDYRTIETHTRMVGEELGRLGLGRLKLRQFLQTPEVSWPDAMWGGCHHMGTTRMAEDPSRGVVDRNCRVHSVDNLYIAGSSVFPTGGYVSPTLTIVALALRLADHLRARLAS